MLYIYIFFFLQEMTKLPSTPLKQIAQTPRIDQDAKFHFNQDLHLPKLLVDEKIDDTNKNPAQFGECYTLILKNF